jgi:YD repeat-containing protein
LRVHAKEKRAVRTRYDGRGRLTEWAKPTASSIQMKYQPMSV